MKPEKPFVMLLLPQILAITTNYHLLFPPVTLSGCSYYHNYHHFATYSYIYTHKKERYTTMSDTFFYLYIYINLGIKSGNCGNSLFPKGSFVGIAVVIGGNQVVIAKFAKIYEKSKKFGGHMRKIFSIRKLPKGDKIFHGDQLYPGFGVYFHPLLDFYEMILWTVSRIIIRRSNTRNAVEAKKKIDEFLFLLREQPVEPTINKNRRKK